MFALVVRFDLHDEEAARGFDALVAETTPLIRSQEPETLVSFATDRRIGSIEIMMAMNPLMTGCNRLFCRRCSPIPPMLFAFPFACSFMARHCAFLPVPNAIFDCSSEREHVLAMILCMKKLFCP